MADQPSTHEPELRNLLIKEIDENNLEIRKNPAPRVAVRQYGSPPSPKKPSHKALYILLPLLLAVLTLYLWNPLLIISSPTSQPASAQVDSNTINTTDTIPIAHIPPPPKSPPIDYQNLVTDWLQSLDSSNPLDWLQAYELAGTLAQPADGSTELASPQISSSTESDNPAIKLKGPPSWFRLSELEEQIFQAFEADSESTQDLTALVSTSPIPIADLFGLGIKTIVIDPGHGGKDPGAIGPNGLSEKEVTLAVAKRLRDQLNQHGPYRALLTREEDVKLSLKQRVAFANAHEADLFISIHLNYLPEAAPTVIETYYFGAQSDPATLRLAEKENQNSGYTLSDFKKMIKTIGDQLKHQESRTLAVVIQKNLYRNIKRHNHSVIDVGIKTAPFAVLMGTHMPSVLSELTCISNQLEEQRLSTPDYRDQLAEYLEQSIIEYLRKNQPEITMETE